MKKISTIILMAILPLIKAQISYTSSDYANSLDEISYLMADLQTTLNFEETGNNMSWNFNSLIQSTTKSIAYTTPSSTNYKSQWCSNLGYTSTCTTEFNNSFNLAQKLTESPISTGTNTAVDDLYSHYYKNSNELVNKMLGLKILYNNSAIPMIMQYQQSDILYKFPMTFGDHYIEPFSYSIDMTTQGIDFKINSNGTRSNDVDGWGSLTVDNKTYDSVIRLKTMSEQQIKRVQNGITVDYTLKTINYQWFSKSYKFPIMDVSMIENNGHMVTTEIKYLANDDFLGINQSNINKAIVYPNPSKGIFKTNIPTDDIISIQVYNMNGQIVSKSLDISNLNKGNYIVKIKTKTQIYTQKVIKD